VNEYKPVIYGLSIDATGRATTAHSARAFEQANLLSCAAKNFGTGKARHACTDDDDI
jgi:hypothetical protein